VKFKDVFRLLVGFLEKEGIDYALIGAFALKAYGYTRATEDVDFIARTGDQVKIIGFLESLGFETLHCSTGYSNHMHPLSGLGRIDLVYVEGYTADSIFADSKRLLIFGDMTVPVVSPEHLIALKAFAMKNDPERLLSEMADIKFLVGLEGIDLERVRRYFDKYGLMEKFHEIMGKT